MAKKVEPEKKEEIKEPEVKDHQEVKKIEEKIDQKIEVAEKKIETVTGERQNIIGDITKPDPTSPTEIREFFKKLDEKIDRLLSNYEKKKKDEEIPPVIPETKKVPWYEREIL